MASANYNNLVSILAVVMACGIVGFGVQMTQRYASESTNVFEVSQTVLGYARPGAHRPAAKRDPNANSQVPLTPEQALVKERFEQAVFLLHGGQYQYAIKALDQVIQFAPKLPEAYVNMSYAYLGLKEYDTTMSAFAKAIDLKPDQANAYYGMAEVLGEKKDLELALGSMRTFIHLSQPDNPYLPKARAALWEWEAELGRVPGIKAGDPGGRSQLIQKSSPHKPSTAKPAESHSQR